MRPDTPPSGVQSAPRPAPFPCRDAQPPVAREAPAGHAGTSEDAHSAGRASAAFRMRGIRGNQFLSRQLHWSRHLHGHLFGADLPLPVVPPIGIAVTCSTTERASSPRPVTPTRTEPSPALALDRCAFGRS